MLLCMRHGVAVVGKWSSSSLWGATGEQNSMGTASAGSSRAPSLNGVRVAVQSFGGLLVLTSGTAQMVPHVGCLG